MKVIGTAGHIDHGKSTLVHRLTGIDPDRLAEEKRRGMTIDLGFAWLSLPSGAEVSIVDVPGHERFVKNMLAGVGGVDVALLVAAADEAVMPQTREHLAILDLLGVRHGVVALSKVDLVDEEWRELALADVEDALVGTTLEGSPIIPVSAVSGAGIDLLLDELDRVVAASPAREDAGTPFVPVDRVFTVAGFGTVVTGTLHNGRLTVGEEVEIVGSRQRARIRGLQTHRREVVEAEPGARVAINLAGPPREGLKRGDVLAHAGTVPFVRRFDARVRVIADAPFPLAHNVDVTLHIGAAERSAVVSVLGQEQLEPGESGWVQIRLSEPVAAVPHQRFIVRLPAPARTIAGGQVVDVIPRHRRFEAAALERLSALSSLSPLDAVKAALPADRPRRLTQVTATVGLPLSVTSKALDELGEQGAAIRIGEAYIARSGWESFTAKVRRTLALYHRENPLRQGMPREELRTKLGWPLGLWPPALRALADVGVLSEVGSAVALPEHRGGTHGRREEADRVLRLLRADPATPPSGSDLLAKAGTDVAFLAAMAQEGEIVKVAEGLYFARDAYDQLVTQTLAIVKEEGAVTVARLRDVASTSRKYALAFLEHLDAERITRRVGDERVLGGRAPTCA